MFIYITNDKSAWRKGVRFIVFPLSFILILGSLKFCRPRPSENNFILITLDTQRADYVGTYDPGNAATPHLDGLAGQGRVYENCYSLIPITLPSHASLFYSQPPHKIKNYNNGQIIPGSHKRISLVSLFKKYGYTTAAFVSLGVLKSEFGLDGGFDLYAQNFPPNRWYLGADEVNDEVFPWLEEVKDRKFMAWIHYSDPHDPYAPPYLPPDLELVVNDQVLSQHIFARYETITVKIPLIQGENEIRFEIDNPYGSDSENFLGRIDLLEWDYSEWEEAPEIRFFWGWFSRPQDNVVFFKNNAFIHVNSPFPDRSITLTFRGKPLLPVEGVKELYRKEVEFMDGEIGKLWENLKALGLFEKTSILVVGDHGEGLGEFTNTFGDPHIGHVHFLHDVYMKVPFILYAPGAVEAGTRITDPVSLLDIAPTILDLMGIKTPSQYEGKSLLEGQGRKSAPIFQETFRPEAVMDRFAVHDYPWQLMMAPEEKTYELFNLEEDPEQERNLYSESRDRSEIRELKQKLDDFVRNVLKGLAPIEIDEKTKEMLKSLGYIK